MQDRAVNLGPGIRCSSRGQEIWDCDGPDNPNDDDNDQEFDQRKPLPGDSVGAHAPSPFKKTFINESLSGRKSHWANSTAGNLRFKVESEILFWDLEQNGGPASRAIRINATRRVSSRMTKPLSLAHFPPKEREAELERDYAKMEPMFMKPPPKRVIERSTPGLDSEKNGTKKEPTKMATPSLI